MRHNKDAELIGLIAICIVIFYSVAAKAQEDIPLNPVDESGTYNMKVMIPTQDPNDEAVTGACCDRIDVDPVVQLGCEPRDPASQLVSFSVNISKTPGDDAEVKCYTENVEGKSPYSSNSYIMVFPLLPNQPTLE